MPFRNGYVENRTFFFQPFPTHSLSLLYSISQILDQREVARVFRANYSERF